MLQAMLAGVASIKAQQTRMNVIGNNIANVNTTAYKGSRVTFQDMIAQTIRGAAAPNGTTGGTNPVQFGLGVLVGGTDTNNEQGSLNATNRPTDIAIQGNGYFLVTNGDTTSYTRDGSFDVDAAGNLVQNSTGLHLMGWSADIFGNIDTKQPVTAKTPLQIPIGARRAVQTTTQVTMAGNLDASSTATDSYSTTTQVYDSLGGAHTITYVFKNRTVPPAATPTPPTGATSQWDWEAYEGDATTGTLVSSSATTGNEPLYFDGNGQMVSNLASGTYNKITVPTSGGTPAFSFDVDYTKITQLNSSSSVSVNNQNGFPPGSLSGFSIGGDGIITGIFTNGLTRSLGQIAMAIFPNPNGMERIGNNLWRNTLNSGDAFVGAANTGGRGGINSGFLEQSNVDIGSEFTEMIITQRGFQSNTKVVTTVDEMMQDLINMKR